jgi:hypothetical protein
MIAPKIVSHVQPTGRDYSATTSPDLITSVPESTVPTCCCPDARHCGECGMCPRCQCRCFEDDWRDIAEPTSAEQSEYGLDLARAVREARAAGELGQVTAGGAVLLFAAVAAVAMVVALSILGLDTAGLEPIVWTNRSFR